MKIKDLINSGYNLSNSDMNLGAISDKDLYHLCQRYGDGIKVLRRIFAVLLVEVNRRKLHRKYGFEGIYEFAAKVGGMNKGLVDQILWLAESLKDKPCLWSEFKKEGWSKVRVVVSVATKETDKIWAEKVSLLSKPALEVFVKDWRRKNDMEENCNENLFNFVNSGNSKNLTNTQTSVPDDFPENSNGNADSTLSKPKKLMVPDFGEVNRQFDSENHCQQTFVKMRFKVTQETEFKFLLFKQKFCKKKEEALTSGEVLAFLLDHVEGKLM